MRRCKRCKEVFTGDQIADWALEKKAFGIRPFVCPSCFAEFTKKDEDEQFLELESMKKGR